MVRPGRCGPASGTHLEMALVGLSITHLMTGGHLISQGIRTIYGPRWNVRTNAAHLLACAVTPSSGRLGLMIVNNGKGAQGGKAIALSHWPVNSSGNGTVDMWQMSHAVQMGSSRALAVKAGITATIDLPDPSVTIISI
jgi:hypothetical protein